MAAKLKKGDTVVVLTGKDKGKTGAISAVMPTENLAIVDKNGKPTRVGFRLDGDKKVRFAKTTGEAI